MKTTKTKRGFAITQFKDSRKTECSIQKSSIACEDRIWLGANKLGISEFIAHKGWFDRSEFDEHTIEHHFVGNNRMELNRKQVAKLIPILQKFVDTGDII